MTAETTVCLAFWGMAENRYVKNGTSSKYYFYFTYLGLLQNVEKQMRGWFRLVVSHGEEPNHPRTDLGKRRFTLQITQSGCYYLATIFSFFLSKYYLISKIYRIFMAQNVLWSKNLNSHL